MTQPKQNEYRWLHNGNEAYASMLEAIKHADRSVCLETYTFKQGDLADQFRDALVEACRRDVKVRVVVDFIGSAELPSSYWKPLKDAGGEFLWFNPWNVWRMGLRDHRKILVCDDHVAFVGGFNIAQEFVGDGITQGWHDIGLRVEGPVAKALREAFDTTFAHADLRPKTMPRWRHSPFIDRVEGDRWVLLLNGPGRGRKHLKRTLISHIKKAKRIDLVAAYFLPTFRIRRALFRASRRTRRVRVILSGRTDLPFTRMAAQFLYQRLLKAHVELHEFRPQILHSKLIIIDDCVYIGSSNLDTRSLNINYELLLRVRDRDLADQAREIFESDLQHCRRIHLEAWKKVRPVWKRLLDRLAYLVLVRIDPFVSRWKAKNVP